MLVELLSQLLLLLSSKLLQKFFIIHWFLASCDLYAAISLFEPQYDASNTDWHLIEWQTQSKTVVVELQGFRVVLYQRQ